MLEQVETADQPVLTELTLALRQAVGWYDAAGDSE